ncbi:amino acid adenylation domain-containing protein [Spongiivirga sp. MCCC 1A20706]|uniref:non-ribosomal peptide synthetase n=1 Tax=Spongiivirga sp. MCCC 1A20706 TaxID=3160963 RepID=UPI00397757D3
MTQQLTTNKKNRHKHDPFAGPLVQKVIHTTRAQSEIWIACELGEDAANRAYNESVTLELKGNLDANALTNAIHGLIGRHESLRCVFSTDGRFMTVLDRVEIDIQTHDFSSKSDTEILKSVRSYLLADANHIFNLVKGPLIKFGLLKLSNTEHHLVITAHHIICDGWSTGIILEELGSLYSAFVKDVDHDLPLAIPFSDYADDELSFLESTTYQDTERFWLDQYKNIIPQISLPSSSERPPVRTYKSNRLDFPINSDTLSSIKQTGIKAGSSFVTTLMTAFEVFLYQQTGQNELTIGLPSSGQSATGKNQLIGHCVNLLPLRSSIDANSTFDTYLKKRKTELFDSYDHQRLSFGELIQKLPIPRDPSRIPLVPIVFNIDMGMTVQVHFEGLDFKLKSNPRTYEAFELFLNATGTEENLILEWSYNSDLFKESEITNMMSAFELVLHKIINNPQSTIKNIISREFEAYETLNNTSKEYPQVSLPILLERQANATPDKRALKFKEEILTYKQFNDKVNQLANCLYDQGIRKGDFVGVALPRSNDQVISLLAVMKCGAAYIPLDPGYPKKRLDFMLNDANAAFLLTNNELSSSISCNAKIVSLEEILPTLSSYPTESAGLPEVDNKTIAYILYTSGSTGKPKGVPVRHNSLVNVLYSTAETINAKEDDILLSITTISFDIVGIELYLPIIVGATMVMAESLVSKDTRLMLELLKKENISLLQATPATWQMLLDAGWNEKLPLRGICCGEALPLSLAKQILNRTEGLWNLYGPTETTIFSLGKEILKTDKLITIGRPVANTQIYILNEQDLILPPGSVGEICIAGDGLASGYWNRPQLTNEKFIDFKISDNKHIKLYRSGDLGKLLPNGEIQCLGRIDQQVKVRGHRIELGEIEDTIDALIGVQRSVVLVQNNRLFATLTTNVNGQSQEMITSWKGELTQLLPAHMVPSEFVIVDDFPKTLNGKIDRKKLLTNLVNSASLIEKSTRPRSASERIIAAIWEESLGVSEIDVFSNFFDLGGHSLVAIKVVSKIEKETGVRLPLAALLEHPTVEKLASFIDTDKKEDNWKSLVAIKPEGSKPPLYIIHGAEHNVLIFYPLAKNLDKEQPVYGLQSKGLDGKSEPNSSIEEMAAYYIEEITSVNPNGPYLLAGYSLGGVIGFEMVRQLEEQGKEVKMLALFDTYVFPFYNYKRSLKKSIVKTLYLLGKILFTLKQMFSSIKNFKHRIWLIKRDLRQVYLRFKYGREKQHEMRFKRSLKLDQMTNLAINNYYIEPQNIEVDLLKVEGDDIFFAHDRKYLGWRRVATKGVNKHMIPGDHGDMFEDTHVKQLGGILQNIMDTKNANL